MPHNSASLHAQWDSITLPRARQRQGFKWSPFAGTDLIPAWVADMDLPASPAITKAITDFYAHGDLGYFEESIYTRAREVCSEWFERRHGWRFSPTSVELVSDTVQSLHLMVRHYSHPGDRVALITPVYHHFYNAIIENGRVPAPITLQERGGEYVIDFDELREQLTVGSTKLLLVCHPHNPTGKVFTPDELLMIAKIAAENGVIVVTDEIHADLTYEHGCFTPFGVIAEETGAPVITLTSAGKAFNIAGTHLGHVIYSDQQLRVRAPQFPSRVNGKPGIAGCLATNVAWTSQEQWLDAAVSYLQRNRDFITDSFRDLPGIRMNRPQATYLAWLDLGEITGDAQEFLRTNANVVTSSGSDFSWPRGTGHQYARLNFATSFPVVQEITERIVDAVSAAQGRC